MNEPAERFLALIHEFEELTFAVSPERAHAEFDEVALQVFWQRWPDLSAWAGSLWRMLSAEVTEAAQPHVDPELDEIGESG
jgi:hypothetical protein